MITCRISLKKVFGRLFKAFVYLIIFFVFVYLVTRFYSLRHGVPFEYVSELSAIDGTIVGSARITCNVIGLREVGLLFEPPIKIEEIGSAQDAIVGTVNLSIDGTKKIINLAETGWSVSHDGIWLKVIDRYQPNLKTCLWQNITIEIEDSNLNLELYSVSLYVSRDRRP